MKAVRLVLLSTAGLGVAALLLLGASASYYGGSDGRGCARCHEIRPAVEAWAASTHRGVACKDCHGSSLSADMRMEVKSLDRLALHLRGKAPEQIRIRHKDVGPLVARCKACHAQEWADWNSGPHGVTYRTIFLDEKHNTRQRLMEDCLRCHGMHFEGGIASLVEPLDRSGPWRLKDSSLETEPAIPCLSCHAVHRNGRPLSRQDRGQTLAAAEEHARPSLALYDRRSLSPVGLEEMPLPSLRDGTRVVSLSPDRRQALCYQCHAPRAEATVFSGDDRTPTGVHEGLSCLSCHSKHGEQTRASCAGCHPRLSNCGLDVETMDTTFHSKASAHNIHRVACIDCHPGGPPKPRKDASGAHPPRPGAS